MFFLFYMTYLFILLSILTIRNCITWEIIRARAHDYKDVNLHVHSHLHTYLYLLTMLWHFYCVLIYLDKHVTLKGQQQEHGKLHEHECSSKKHNLRCTRHILYIGMRNIHQLCLFQESVKSIWQKYVHVFIRDISTNQHKCSINHEYILLFLIKNGHY